MTTTSSPRPHVLAVVALVALLGLAGPDLAPWPSVSAAPANYDHNLVGNPADAITSPSGGLLLMGGGTDVDAAFAWMIGRSGGGDFLVLRATGTDAYNPYILGLGPADSVETIVLKNRRASTQAFVLDRIRAAEAIFFAGGDQADYVDRIKGTPIEDEVHAAVARGVPVGGTSAGLAVIGEFLFSAARGTVTSAEALADPFNRRVALDRDFLVLPRMANVITDSHFAERDRMGRFVAFLARLAQDGWTTAARGIAIDSETAVLVDAAGAASIVANPGDDTPYAYFLQAPGLPELAAPKTPLTYMNVGVYRVTPGASFNLNTWSGSNGIAYTVSATAGVLGSSRPGGEIY
jgi:cyanophycinase